MNIEKDKGFAWQHIEWYSTKQIVLRLQRRIYKARKDRNISRVRWLQKLLIRNYQAKLYSVLQVTTLNKGQTFPGEERFVTTTDEQKLKLAKNLKIDDMVCRPPANSSAAQSENPRAHLLGISKIRDRAKQVLCKLALEPEWEAVFEANSFGHRPGRSVHDVVEAFFLCMHSNIVKHVYIVDFVGCFEKVNHTTLLRKLNTFSLMEKQISAWLKAGIFESYSRVVKEPTLPTMSIPQGGILSPFLVNVVLHGLETYLKERVVEMNFKVSTTGPNAKRRSLSVIRYGDHFAIVHRDVKVIKQLVLYTKDWFLGLGLELPEQSSIIKDARQGFDFLGFQHTQVRKNERYKIQIVPSRKSQKDFLLQIRNIVQKKKSVSSYVLINELRPRVIGWANYYKYCESSETFSRVNHLIFQKVRGWVFRRHPRQSRTEIKKKYFPEGRTYKFHDRSYQQNWILTGESLSAGKKKISNFLPNMAWVLSKKHVKIKQDKSPFDSDFGYWCKRICAESSYTTRQKELLKDQDYRCNLCGHAFDFFDTTEVDHIIPPNKEGNHAYFNLQIVHRGCRVKKSKLEYNRQT